MATKYVPEQGTPKSPAPLAKAPFQALNEFKPQQRRGLTALAVLAAAAAIFLYMQRYQNTQFSGQSLERTVGVILTKEEAGQGQNQRHLLRVKITLPDGTGATAPARTDTETWNRLKPGDRIGVIYQRDKATGKAVRLRETGTFALPPGSIE